MDNAKRLQKLIDSQKIGLNKDEQKETKSTMLLTDSAITRLFSRMGSIFPSAEYLLRDPNRLKDMKEVWGAGLSKAGITDLNIIGKGLDYAMSNGGSFMPSLPEFIKWCKIGAFPDVELSYKSFMNYLNNGIRPDCELVQHCVMNIDLFKAKNGQIDTRKVFESTYKRAIDMNISGQELSLMKSHISIEQVVEPVLDSDEALDFIDNFLNKHSDSTWANDIEQ